jgi:hypothetical protein
LLTAVVLLPLKLKKTMQFLSTRTFLVTVSALSIAAAVSLTLGTYITAGNYVGIVVARRTGVGFSCIPVLGGLLGCVGFLLLPRIRFFGFVPPLIDPGCVMMFALLIRLLRKDPKASR